MRVCAITVLTITCAVAQAQSVYRCDDGGRVTYSQMGCPRGTPSIVNVRPNSIDTSAAHEYNLRKIRQAEIEEEIARRRAQEYIDEAEGRPTRRGFALTPKMVQAREEDDPNLRRDRQRARDAALKAATTPLPGSRGLTRAQREAAASLSSTQQERNQLMREAATPLPGGDRGSLTASQLDTLRRLANARDGEPLPPSTLPPPPPSPPPAPPSVLVNCDSAGCWDTNGNRYNNAAGGGNFTRSDGKFCTGSGATLICN